MPKKSRGGGEGKYRRVSTYEDEYDNYNDDDDIMDAVRSQQQMLQEQDESLDILGAGAARLGQISLEISSELKTQNKMLDGMGDELDNAELNLAVVTKKTQELIKKSGGCGYFS
eukprot:CAMPEP_0118658264 /NCGR_PEP_ID=MMETSP0785-20121206/14475_1 /TAXON_ID=91992 /ORGANISM="Bolidomonas pacifica, Strain CCMP 1866" /LENGTH=113 /DNA_ID=CAMNT_0006551269 /DNA_START=49 /DNA_END=387 /DNA_ORIENTATION=+